MGLESNVLRLIYWSWISYQCQFAIRRKLLLGVNLMYQCIRLRERGKSTRFSHLHDNPFTQPQLQANEKHHFKWIGCRCEICTANSPMPNFVIVSLLSVDLCAKDKTGTCLLLFALLYKLRVWDFIGNRCSCCFFMYKTDTQITSTKTRVCEVFHFESAISLIDFNSSLGFHPFSAKIHPVLIQS